MAVSDMGLSTSWIHDRGLEFAVPSSGLAPHVHCSEDQWYLVMGAKVVDDVVLSELCTR